ncbi:phage protease [Rhizobium sp. SL86]|uniref:phage protease n=1 Tax=Rhizobium sp. SL86 TaxID=2995148 RepID=UPI002276A969|nr:phage protease [Rhizobium sp. SL86]MCY1668610.1 hypothetical protein [Rhizobium sp. SL86]
MSAALQSSSAQPLELKPVSSEDRRQWVQLVTMGAMKTVDGRGPYVVEDAPGLVANSFRNISTDKLPIDYEHAIDVAAPKGIAAPAAGWISEMNVRSDGVWGLVEWTPRAAQLIRDKEFRFLSPVLLHTPDMKVKKILRASLTNNPNLTLKSLNAAEKGSPVDHETFMRDLRAALGLPETADEAAVIDAVKTSKSAQSADPARYVPIDLFQQTLAELHKTRSGISLQAAEFEVEQLIKAGRLLPFMRDWSVSLCQVNKAAFDDFMEGAGKPVGEFISSLQSPAYDWSKMREKDVGGFAELTDIHKNLGHSAEDVKNFGGKTER